MNYRKITAIIDADSLEAVEAALQRLNVTELAVTHVKGYGDYKNFYTPEWIAYQARVEIYVAVAKTQQVVDAVIQAAHTGLDTDGIIAVLPVETLYRIKDHAPLRGP